MNSFALPLLLFGSGLAALICQVVWMREFRLIFGASSLASAAVLGIFMGGLGLGSLLLGPRADRSSNPLRMYANLELWTALSAAVTPLLLAVGFQTYIWLGGVTVLGSIGATVVRLAISGAILLAPTFLMGGTLPAAVTSFTTDRDTHRTNLALLYGANALGAVTGAFLATFFLLERLGNRFTLWSASALLVVISLLARFLSHSAPSRTVEAQLLSPSKSSIGWDESSTQTAFLLFCSALLGFIFFQMELVWYRMLAQILGGSVFTFGLILAVAIAGIGIGGLSFSFAGKGTLLRSMRGLALLCALEAAFTLFPLALGDRIAFLTLDLRESAGVHFWQIVRGWSLVTVIVALPSSIVAGFLFPLVVSLLGEGSFKIGRHVGWAYGANTFGAILGSLIGGFYLLPTLGAVGSWREAGSLLIVLSLVAMFLSIRKKEGRLLHLLTLYAAALSIFIVFRQKGPTAVWRHSAIGSGRAKLTGLSSNARKDWARTIRRNTVWEGEGRESSVAVSISDLNGIGLLTNGKSDGSVVGDRGTLVMAGLLGPLANPQATNALIIGLGTGGTAGWLAEVPTMKEVDVVELEPSVLHAAQMMRAGNFNALEHPKVRMVIGDAREVVVSTPKRYDIIFSEPSNPYRAGVSSFFTEDFYRFVKTHLRKGGVFIQWIQAYEIERPSIESVYKTMTDIFPHVETWQSKINDLILIASEEDITYDISDLRKRLRQLPFEKALAATWRAVDAEGLFSRYVGGSILAKTVAQMSEATRSNTDDRMTLEFAFARSVGQETPFHLFFLQSLALSKNDHHPRTVGGSVDWDNVKDQSVSMYPTEGVPPPLSGTYTEEERHRVDAKALFANHDYSKALDAWRRQKQPPKDTLEFALVAAGFANNGDSKARRYLEALRPYHPTEALAIEGWLQYRQNDFKDAEETWNRAFIGLRSDPWVLPSLIENVLSLVNDLAVKDHVLGLKLFEILREPFALQINHRARLNSLLTLAKILDSKELCSSVIAGFEPDVPWQLPFLMFRKECYAESGDPRTRLAEQDVADFLKMEPK